MTRSLVGAVAIQRHIADDHVGRTGHHIDDVAIGTVKQLQDGGPAAPSKLHVTKQAECNGSTRMSEGECAHRQLDNTATCRRGGIDGRLNGNAIVRHSVADKAGRCKDRPPRYRIDRARRDDYRS